MERLRVYLSSTYEDLKDYRKAVFAGLKKAGLEVARMEDYTAADKRPLDLCLNDVAQSDIYVGLYAWRYGYEPPAAHGNLERKSITELEYRRAESKNLRKLLFFAHPDTKGQWPDRFKDEVTGEGKRGAKLNALRQELGTEKTAGFFRTPDELATLVLAAIMRSGLSGRPYNISPRPPGFVPRAEPTKALVESLIGTSSSVPGMHTLLQGAGGFGKSTLAIMHAIVRRSSRRSLTGSSGSRSAKSRTSRRHCAISLSQRRTARPPWSALRPSDRRWQECSEDAAA